MEAALTAMTVKIDHASRSEQHCDRQCDLQPGRNQEPDAFDRRLAEVRRCEREVHGAGTDEQRGHEPLHPSDARCPSERLR